MNEFKAETLASGSKSGPKVTNPKQAIAIMLSEKDKEAKGSTAVSGGKRGPKRTTKLLSSSRKTI